ncbi:MATE family efflux transporter [Vibrio alginolyticus]|nr:MATE family efflux transporter [Vibrio alginolyticus]
MTISRETKLIIERTLPLTLGVLSIMSVQLIDTIFIGKLGLEALSAQGLTISFSTVIIAIQVGLSVAATCSIARFVGEKQRTTANEMATLFMLVGGAIIAALTLFLWKIDRLLFALFIDETITGSQLELVKAQFSDYWGAWLFSAFCGAMFYFVSSVYRANQDSKTPGMMLIISSVINFILDPILIFTLDLGISGAALASSISFALCGIYMFLAPRAKGWFSWLPVSHATYQNLLNLLSDAASTTANQILPAVSALVSITFIASVGPEAVAVWGVLMRMEGFLLVLSLSLTMSVPPIISSYLGSNKINDIDRLIKSVAKLTIVTHTCVAFVIFMFSSFITEYIGQGLNLEREIHSALLFLPLSYGPLGLCMVVVSVFNALGLPKRALMVSFIRLLILFVPAIYLGAQTNDIKNVIAAAAIANVMAGLSAWVAMSRQLKQHSNLKMLATI